MTKRKNDQRDSPSNRSPLSSKFKFESPNNVSVLNEFSSTQDESFILEPSQDNSSVLYPVPKNSFLVPKNVSSVKDRPKRNTRASLGMLLRSGNSKILPIHRTKHDENIIKHQPIPKKSYPKRVRHPAGSHNNLQNKNSKIPQISSISNNNSTNTKTPILQSHRQIFLAKRTETENNLLERTNNKKKTDSVPKELNSTPKFKAANNQKSLFCKAPCAPTNSVKTSKLLNIKDIDVAQKHPELPETLFSSNTANRKVITKSKSKKPIEKLSLNQIDISKLSQSELKSLGEKYQKIINLNQKSSSSSSSSSSATNPNSRVQFQRWSEISNLVTHFSPSKLTTLSKFIPEFILDFYANLITNNHNYIIQVFENDTNMINVNDKIPKIKVINNLHHFIFNENDDNKVNNFRREIYAAYENNDLARKIYQFYKELDDREMVRKILFLKISDEIESSTGEGARDSGAYSGETTSTSANNLNDTSEFIQNSISNFRNQEIKESPVLTQDSTISSLNSISTTPKNTSINIDDMKTIIFDLLVKLITINFLVKYNDLPSNKLEKFRTVVDNYEVISPEKAVIRKSSGKRMILDSESQISGNHTLSNSARGSRADSRMSGVSTVKNVTKNCSKVISKSISRIEEDGEELKQAISLQSLLDLDFDE